MPKKAKKKQYFFSRVFPVSAFLCSKTVHKVVAEAVYDDGDSADKEFGVVNLEKHI